MVFVNYFKPVKAEGYFSYNYLNTNKFIKGTLKPKFYLWQRDEQESTTPLNLAEQDGMRGVDVSKSITDRYKYRIAFVFTNPVTLKEEIHYQTTGELQFDTGSGRGLAIGEKLWKQIGDDFQNLNLKKGRDCYPYIGRLPCQKGIIPKLQVGDRIISKAEISIFPDDSPLLAECEGLLGMQYFNDTIVVLDFEKSLMWVEEREI